MKTLRNITFIAFALFALNAAVLFGPAQSGSAQSPTPTPTPPPVPTGVFYLPNNRTIDSRALGNSNVDGVVVAGRWSDLEPSKGVFDFNHATQGQSLAHLVSQVEAAGKPMRLEIQTGGPDVKPGPTVCPGCAVSTGAKPHWLIKEITNDSYTGCKFFTYKVSDNPPTTATIPVFWEPTLLAEHAALVQAVANYFPNGAHPLIEVVFVPYANARTDDWNLGDISDTPDGIPDPCGNERYITPKIRWLNTIPDSGYANMGTALIAAGTYTYNAYHTAFPTKILTTSIGRLDDPDLNPGGIGIYGRNISETVVSTANNNWPGYIAAQKLNLNGGCPSTPCPNGGVLPAPGIQQNGTPTPWNDLYRLHTLWAIPTAVQMVFAAYDDPACTPPPSPTPTPTPDHYLAQRMDAGVGSPCMDSTQMLYQAVNTGVTYETQWQEIWELDIGYLDGMNHDPHPSPSPAPDVIQYAHQLLHH